ncbi:MAG: class I SAM-dependent methyltransferase [Chloroflexota bacterium]|nr:class I SAM-dependent methyltransferase [Chloroflexota bacterium]
MLIPFDARWVRDHLLAMPFDQYQRYRLTAELVLALKTAAGATNEPWRILDVGGFFPTKDGVLPLPSWMPDDDVLVVDTVRFEGSHYRQASGTGLPFTDGSWVIVTSCDTLEHIPPTGRATFLAELRRVARRVVILAAPHATAGVQPAELALDEYLRSFDYHHQMLAEHLQYGVPDPAWVDTWLREQGAGYTAFPSGYLPRWQLMMFLKHLMIALPEMHLLHERLDQTYNERFFERDQRAPGYRRVYLIAAPGTPPPDLKAFVERAARPEPEDIAGDLLGITALPVVRALSMLGRTQQASGARIEALQASYERLEQCYAELATTHADLGAMLGTAVRDAGRIEGEKRVLQQQIEFLTWQNQLLHAQLQGPGRRAVTAAGRIGRRLWRGRS